MWKLKNLSIQYKMWFICVISSQGINDLMKLWYHESCRVFQDRLVNDEDRNWFDDLMKTKMKEDFKVDPAEVLKNQPIIFGDFLTQGGGDKPYVEITDHEKVMEHTIYSGSTTIFCLKFLLYEQTRGIAFCSLELNAVKHISFTRTLFLRKFTR